MTNIEALKKFIIQKLSSGLSGKLRYHGVHHTLEVLNVGRQYIKRLHLTEHDAYLLETAALTHDTGYMFTVDNHEEASKKYIKEILPDWNYTTDEIESICGMIEATKIPQKPTNILEQIIGDSDLDYLGTDAFYEKSEMLFAELSALNKIKSREEWKELQIKFLQSHRYHTQFAKKHREPVKQKHLKELLENV